MSDKESRTEKDSFVEERILGDHHYKTTISDGSKQVEGRGRTSEESQRTASEKWDKSYGSDSGGSGSGSGSSGGGCLLATACLEARGLSHNCRELDVLRTFRDEYVRRLQNGEEIIHEYYSVAPRIIEGINKSGMPKQVYESIYEELDAMLKAIESADMTWDGVLRQGLATIDKLKKDYQ